MDDVKNEDDMMMNNGLVALALPKLAIDRYVRVESFYSKLNKEQKQKYDEVYNEFK